MQANILRYYFKIQTNIYKLLQLPKNKPSQLYITARKNAFDATEVLKTFEINNTLVSL